MEQDLILFEQPLNELLRACLRLEQLFSQIDQLIFSADVASHSHLLVSHIIYVLNILDRPDLKAKFSQELNRHLEHFSKLQNSPDIDRDTLKTTIKKMEYLKQYFLSLQGKLGQSLRENEFLSQIRLNLLSHSGGSFIDTPAYFQWLQLSAPERQKAIHEWLNSFTDIRSATQLLLEIVRNSTKEKKIVAQNGFYHQSLTAQSSCQMIRVALPKNLQIYPEISAGRHRLTVRFLVPDIKNRPKQAEKNIEFGLTCCFV